MLALKPSYSFDGNPTLAKNWNALPPLPSRLLLELPDYAARSSRAPDRSRVDATSLGGEEKWKADCDLSMLMIGRSYRGKPELVVVKKSIRRIADSSVTLAGFAGLQEATSEDLAHPPNLL